MSLDAFLSISPLSVAAFGRGFSIYLGANSGYERINMRMTDHTREKCRGSNRLVTWSSDSQVNI